MTNLLLINDNLKQLIESLKINKEQKDLLILKLPQLDEAERIKLLDVLKEVYLLDLEELAALEKIEKGWKK